MHSQAAVISEGQVINPIAVSRSDSTLRGHYPVETDIIAEELGPFDAHFNDAGGKDSIKQQPGLDAR